MLMWDGYTTRIFNDLRPVTVMCSSYATVVGAGTSGGAYAQESTVYLIISSFDRHTDWGEGGGSRR